jgi:predicted MFS family arabinose efflux permease
VGSRVTRPGEFGRQRGRRGLGSCHLVKAVLRISGYRRLLAAYGLNELAWSVGALVLAVLVYRRTGSALEAASFFLCSQFLPALISPALVARLDRRAPRGVLTWLYGAQAAAFLAIAWAASRLPVVVVLALVVAAGTVALTARAIARATTVAVISPHGLLREGNAVTNSTFAVANTAGPVLGGALVLAGGTTVGLICGSVLFAVVALTLLGADALPGAAAEAEPGSGRVARALAYARRDPVIRGLLGLQATAILIFTISIPVELLYAQSSLHAGAGGYGALLSAWGAGAVAGSALYARWRRAPSRTLIAAASVLLAAGFLGMAVAPTLAFAVAGSALGGAGNGIEVVAARTTLQERVAPQMMALMMSLTESISQVMPGAGILLGGGIAALAGARIAFVVASAGAAAIALIALVVLPAADTPAAQAAASAIDATAC